ncbi:MAG: hypothetical protein QOF76_173 [Solirubrobacteraceae bacterium]|nr:hypothetical protein [Solirubrobacteraceae bacterium]
MTNTYRITHSTEYVYASFVKSGYSQLRLLPRDGGEQRCLQSRVIVRPAPDDRHEHLDFFGNRVSYVALQERHRKLTVVAESVVEVHERPGLSLFGDMAWETVRDAVGSAGDEGVAAAHFALDSSLVTAGPAFAAYAAPSFTPGRPIADAVVDLSTRIHRDFKYKPGKTRTDTPPDVVLRKRLGVCQDFAHVGIACMRSLGLPARYVSGYLETDPPPGRPRLVGADASHAWFSALVPGAGWLDVDPTNDQVVNERYVVVGYGRDYRDVAPVSGVIFTRGRTKSLTVTVDVVPV